MRLWRLFAAIILVAVTVVTAACSLLADLDGLASAEPFDADAGTRGDPDAQPPAIEGGPEAAVDATTDREAGTTYADNVLADHPVVYLRLGDSALDVAKNERPTGNGKYTGTSTMLGNAGLIAGDPDKAVRLQNKGRIAVPLVPGLFVGKAPYTIEAWIALDAPDGAVPTQWIVGREDVTNPRFGASLLVDGAGVAMERWANQDASRVNGSKPRFDGPNHVVGTFDGTTIQIWVDGVPGPVASSPQDIPDNAFPTVIGSQSSQLTGFLQGSIDEVALYDYVLSPARIMAHARVGRGE
jgi:hypothetical protein